MSGIAKTPSPPYYAVIFSSVRTAGDHGYGAMADRMLELAAQQEGFLGFESAREMLVSPFHTGLARKPSKTGSKTLNISKPSAWVIKPGTPNLKFE